MKAATPVLLILLAIPCSASQEPASIEALQFGPLESFAISLYHAKTGDWDNHFSFSIHSSMEKELREKMESMGKDAFVKMYREKKIPQQVTMFAQVRKTEPRHFEYKGEQVALLVLKEAVGSTHGILMYRDGDHYAFKNNSNLNETELKSIRDARE